MNTREERRLQARADDIERELRSRRSPSVRQAEAAVKGDRRRDSDGRTTHDDELDAHEERFYGDEPEESSASATSRRQAARATRRSSRGDDD